MKFQIFILAMIFAFNISAQKLTEQECASIMLKTFSADVNANPLSTKLDYLDSDCKQNYGASMEIVLMQANVQYLSDPSQNTRMMRTLKEILDLHWTIENYVIADSHLSLATLYAWNEEYFKAYEELAIFQYLIKVLNEKGVEEKSFIQDHVDYSYRLKSTLEEIICQ